MIHFLPTCVGDFLPHGTVELGANYVGFEHPDVSGSKAHAGIRQSAQLAFLFRR